MKTYIRKPDNTFPVETCYAWPLKAKVVMLTDDDKMRYYVGDFVYLHVDGDTQEWKLAFMGKGKFNSIFEEYVEEE